jgi:hypothetical protein
MASSFVPRLSFLLIEPPGPPRNACPVASPGHSRRTGWPGPTSRGSRGEDSTRDELAALYSDVGRFGVSFRPAGTTRQASAMSAREQLAALLALTMALGVWSCILGFGAVAMGTNPVVWRSTLLLRWCPPSASSS